MSQEVLDKHVKSNLKVTCQKRNANPLVIVCIDSRTFFSHAYLKILLSQDANSVFHLDVLSDKIV